MTSKKRPIECLNAKIKKKKRKRLTLECKLEVLRRIEMGHRQVDVCNQMKLAGSTVRGILKSKEKIMQFSNIATPLNGLKLSRSRAPIMLEMENLLSTWIKENDSQCKPLTMNLIQNKAKSIYDSLKKNLPEGIVSDDFVASKGWFERFKKRIELNNVSLPEEPTYENFDVDMEVIACYKNELEEIIEEGGYTSQQIFNVDETGLFWKRFPYMTSISSKEKSKMEFNISHDRLTLLLGGNAAGDFKLKPLLVYHMENPRALRGYLKSTLPVMWKSNKKAWVTISIFQSWFKDYFCPAVEKYCIENNLPNKALLILDNAPGHPTTLDDLSDNVKVAFLPPNTASLLQPMDQGIIYAFKVYYMQKLFAQAAKAIDENVSLTLNEFCTGYNIRQAIHNISSAWDEITSETMNSVWKNLSDNCIQDFKNFEETLMSLQDNIIELGKKVGFEELQPEDIQQLIDSHKEEISEEDFVKLKQERSIEEEYDDDDEEYTQSVKSLTSQGMAEAFRHLDAFLSYFDENDPDVQRSSAVAKGVNNQINCYRILYNEKKAKV